MDYEGYIGIKLQESQLVTDTMFAFLLLLLVSFALVFHSHSHLFMKMLKDVFQIKQRKSLFEIELGNTKGSEKLFRGFITFQSLFLCSLSLFFIGMYKFEYSIYQLTDILIVIGVIFFLLLLFYFFKQGMYNLLGWVFVDPEQYKLFRVNYHAVIGFWGIVLYIPFMLLAFTYLDPMIAIYLFAILYLLSRAIIFYKIIRIFHIKKDGILFLMLYLCAQEILPLFFLYKGVIYLYNFIDTSNLWR